ncbi:MAG: hypothetical protein DMF88_02780 [Acidobacteria bacterium]|nr:MAG: hypothetical protein DMF88_02780 [Acidobacteriota bacterium]
MKNVLLFFPRLSPDEITETRFLMPLSLIYVATPLREAGYNVSILDARLRDDWKEELRRRVESLDPVCVGISSLTGIQLRTAMEAAREVKRLSADLPVVWGGVHASLLPLETMREDFVDFVVVGEGELTFTELVKCLDQGKTPHDVMGIWYKDDGVPKRNPEPRKIDLNSLPALAYDLVDMPRYYQPFWDTEPTGPTFITSRGCPFQCAYCYIEVFDQRLWRPIRPEKVIENLQHLIAITGTRSVFCLDDMFFTDIRRVKQMCRLIIDAGMHIELDNVNCRADAVCRFDDEMLELLTAAGVRRLFVGLETGTNRMLKLIQKGSTREQAIRANQILSRSPIQPIYAFMAGFPHETIQDVKDTLSLMAKLLDENPNALITETSFYTPFPGTTLFQECLKMGIRLPQTMEEWSRMSYNHLQEELFTPEQIDFLYRVKTLSAYLDHKNYETMRHSMKTTLKRIAARVISKEFRWRVKNEFFFPFPERRWLVPPSDV